VSALLLLTNALQPSAEVLPALALLPHTVKVLPAEGSALLEAPAVDLVLVDGRQDLLTARDLTRLIRTVGTVAPVLLIVTEGGLSAVAVDWGFDDVVLTTAGPAEVEARLRLAHTRLLSQRAADDPEAHVIRSGNVTVDDVTYTAKLGGRPLDLTFKEFELLKYLAQHPGRVFSREQLLQEVWGYDYFGGTRTVDVHVRRLRAKLGGKPLDLTFKEFELLKYLAQHPGRVFTREQLLQEVWGYDYFGGTRTVDVHVRRLRAKLGPEHEQLIGTVRNVGYRFVVPPSEQSERTPATT
jgi:DNA-binding response OmpR family regulator